jgi:hypothetical protein
MSIYSRRFALAACALLPLMAACGESPEEVTQRFIDSVQEGEVSTAINLISAESREAVGDEQLRDGLMRGIQQMEKDEQVTVVQGGDDAISSNGRSARVTVVASGDEEPTTIHPVKEGRSWKIDLSNELY